MTSEPGKSYRWFVLLFVSLAMFGNYYIYDSIAPIADILKAQLGFSDENLGQLYSVYSIAAIIILLVGGVVVDRYGTKISILIFSIISSIAALVTWMSPDLVMLLGRCCWAWVLTAVVAITTALQGLKAKNLVLLLD
jgi:MFS family permease